MADSSNFVYSQISSEVLLALVVFVGLFFMLTDRRRRSADRSRRLKKSRPV